MSSKNARFFLLVEATTGIYINISMSWLKCSAVVLFISGRNFKMSNRYKTWNITHFPSKLKIDNSKLKIETSMTISLRIYKWIKVCFFISRNELVLKDPFWLLSICNSISVYFFHKPDCIKCKRYLLQVSVLLLRVEVMEVTYRAGSSWPQKADFLAGED